MTALAAFSLLFAAWPALLFLRNLRAFQGPPHESGFTGDVSILIPARDEARNISAAVEAALVNAGAEVLVLDDCSTDHTSEIVAGIAAREPRLQLLRGGPMPRGWCGKNWACSQLAEAATRPLLLFVDADVRLEGDAAASIAHWLRSSGAQFGSGVPQQELGSFWERLLIPLIHFVLLGFLPLQRMRRSRHPAYAAGCGQLLIIEAEAYWKAGGHAAIRDKIHDGLALPKLLREAGFATDLFDATGTARCRMYRNATETWRGLSKNTHEGLGAPARIVPITLILLGGEVLPFLLLIASPWLTFAQSVCAAIGVLMTLVTRALAGIRFRQPLAIIPLHPFAILSLVGFQWAGLVRYLRGRPSEWKGRTYSDSAGDRVAAADAGEQIPKRIEHALHSRLN